MTTRTPMTSVGYRSLQEEVSRLKTTERRKASKAIEEARAHGDLSENAEYDAAKNAQGLLEAKIRDLESRLSTAEVIELTKLSGKKVVFGATAEIQDLATDEKRVVTIVGEHEADVDRGLISYLSPLARALIGKNEGDTTTVKLPAGEKDYELLAVRFDFGT